MRLQYTINGSWVSLTHLVISSSYSFFPILNEFKYAFDEFRPILHGVKLTKLWIPIWEQKFLILVLILYEYTIIRASIRRYAQKLELHSWDTIISYIDSDCCTLICPTKWSTPFNMYDLMKAVEFGISSIMCGITGTWSTSIYEFIRGDMIGKFFSCNFILQWSHYASM